MIEDVKLNIRALDLHLGTTPLQHTLQDIQKPSAHPFVPVSRKASSPELLPPPDLSIFSLSTSQGGGEELLKHSPPHSQVQRVVHTNNFSSVEPQNSQEVLLSSVTETGRRLSAPDDTPLMLMTLWEKQLPPSGEAFSSTASSSRSSTSSSVTTYNPSPVSSQSDHEDPFVKESQIIVHQSSVNNIPMERNNTQLHSHVNKDEISNDWTNNIHYQSLSNEKEEQQQEEDRMRELNEYRMEQIRIG
eukprot:CAMPEP_0170124342 /NCGR_PEP_ID=MMETSP0020_2-20130122/18171_1 /TAXON_ID=98059 /ORGANISM="Dinobryon sp., Strain UTEXLB2267" /LENGTH=244 /DNA_ID=CAMNT_0010356359 /DNA_START=1 /DNA_END=733 /DNA_ORIENTATION=-